MGKITVKTKESSGQTTYETETIYESSEDFFFIEDQKVERLNNAIKSYVGGLGSLVDEPMIADIQVGLKPKKEVKH